MGIKQAIDSLKESIASAFSAFRSELDSANNAAEERKNTVDQRIQAINTATEARKNTVDQRIQAINTATEARKNTVDQKIQTIEQNMRDAGHLNKGTIPDARLPTNARGSKTVSTSFPSGGSNGDTWLKY